MPRRDNAEIAGNVIFVVGTQDRDHGQGPPLQINSIIAQMAVLCDGALPEYHKPAAYMGFLQTG